MSNKITQDTTGFTVDDWNAIRDMVKGSNDPYNVTVEEINRAQSGKGYVFKGTRNEVDNAIASYKTSAQYTDKLKAKEAATSQANASTAVQGYETPEFKFDPNNPYLNQQRQAIEQSSQEVGRAIQKQLASRGLTDSGQLGRSLSALYKQKQSGVQQAVGQDFVRQQQNAAQEDSQKFSKLLQKYNVSSTDYNNYMDQFYKSQAVAQQNALQQWLTAPEKIGIDIGTELLKTAVKAAVSPVAV